MIPHLCDQMSFLLPVCSAPLPGANEHERFNAAVTVDVVLGEVHIGIGEVENVLDQTLRVLGMCAETEVIVGVVGLGIRRPVPTGDLTARTIDGAVDVELSVRDLGEEVAHASPDVPWEKSRSL